MNSTELKELIKKTWSINLEISIHTIGDEAAHQVVLAANDLWNDGYQGLINLEHAQMLREDTIQLMKQKPITCYMQPCHWLSDKRWLKTKVHDLFNTCFPWRALEENQIKFYFGSDSPIEKPNIFDNQMAIQDAALQGISPTLMNSFHYQTHPDKTWIKNCFSEFEDQKCIRLHFDNQRII